MLLLKWLGIVLSSFPTKNVVVGASFPWEENRSVFIEFLEEILAIIIIDVSSRASGESMGSRGSSCR